MRITDQGRQRHVIAKMINKTAAVVARTPKRRTHEGWDEHFTADGLLPAAVFKEQREAVRMTVRGINDQLAFGVGSANDQ